MPASARPRLWLRFAGVLVALLGLTVTLAAWNWERVMPALVRLDPALRASPHYTDPEDTGPDFLVQGEYAAPGAPWAAQIIAGGQGAFTGRILPGGLPGAGWTGEQPIRVSGDTEGRTTRLSGDGTTVAIANGTLQLHIDGAPRTTLGRIERASPTLGAEPPARARVLFGPGATSGFDGRTDEHGRLMEGATTHDSFGDFLLHLEFRTPFEPGLEAQKRGNSGVYIQKRYEVQVLDSFGLEGADNECGGLYEQKSPDVNMALPPLAWQTYDIEFTAARFGDRGERSAPARMTVRHNGVVVHDDVSLSGPTGAGAAETAEPGPLFLQDHGNPVRYRNVWLVPAPTDG